MPLPKVLVFGRAGQLGAELVRVFSGRGHQVAAVGRAEVDVTDVEAVQRAVEEHMPAFVLNATAYNMVDLAEREPQAAFAGNALAVRNMAVACRQADAMLVHFSTDYVFDGTAGRPYVEDDATHPLGAYAVSKLAGELYAQAYLDNALILRTSGVFGLAGLGTARGNFVETMLRLAARNEPIRVVDGYCASPTFAPELAERTADLLALGVSGVFHAGGGSPVTWLDFARMIFELASVQPQLLAVSDREYRTLARRPRFSALSNAKLESAGVSPMPPFQECLRAYMAGRSEILSSQKR